MHITLTSDVLNDAAPSKLARAVRRRQSCTGSPRLTSSACCCGRTMPCSSNRSHSSVAGLPSRPPIRVLSRSRLCTLRWCCFRTTYVATKSELAAVYESIHPFVNFSAANGTYALDGRGALCSTAERWLNCTASVVTSVHTSLPAVSTACG